MEEAPIARTASVAQVATACNIDARHVQRLTKEGVLPREARGAYNLGKCMAAYIRYLQKAMSAKSIMDGSGQVSNTSEQRSKLLAVEVRLGELALAKAESEVITVAEYEEDLSTLVVETKAALMAVGARVAQHIVGQTSRATIQWAIDAGVKEAMAKLAARAPRRPPPAPKKRKRARANRRAQPPPAVAAS
jgi:hypothetical protein